MTTGLNLHILVILGADLAQLESGAHLTVQLILLLRGRNEATMSFLCLNTVTSHATTTPPVIILKDAARI